nr:T6SS immunity protein Tli4 family protein [Pseudoxanthomonas sp.]
MRIRLPLGVLGLVLLLSLAGCASFSSSRRSSLDTTGWVTHCFGRFLVDLPPDATLRTYYLLEDGHIERLYDTPAGLAERISRREHDLRTQAYDPHDGLFVRRVEFGENSTGLLSRSTDVANAYLLDTYVVAQPAGHAYHWAGRPSADRVPPAMEFSAALARNLRSRGPREIPGEPGFCIDRAYLAGDSVQTERYGVGIIFSGHPGVNFEFRVYPRNVRKGRSRRIGSLKELLPPSSTDMKKLRNGKRRGGHLRAEQYLVAGGDQGQRGYTFLWRVPGKEGSRNEPRLTAVMGTAERSDVGSGHPPPAFTSDHEALALWNAIVGSIRARPTSPPLPRPH